MPASEFQKKAISFVVVAGLIVLALILFPALEELVRGNLAATFGLIVAPDGSVSYPSGDGMGTMTSTYVGVIVTVIQILKVILAMALVVAVVRFFSYLVKKTVNRNASQGEISSLLHTVLSIIVYIVAFFIIFQSQFPGIQLTALFTGSTIVGIVVGLALQDTLGNLFAGLALQADQSFQVGDVISVGTLGNGVVESVSWRGAKIRTFQNKLLVISNAALGKESLEVAPKDNLNARLVFFNTVYTASPAHTAQVVREAIRVSENVAKDSPDCAGTCSRRGRDRLGNKILAGRLFKIQRHGRANSPAGLVRLPTRENPICIRNPHHPYRGKSGRSRARGDRQYNCRPSKPGIDLHAAFGG